MVNSVVLLFMSIILAIVIIIVFKISDIDALSYIFVAMIIFSPSWFYFKKNKFKNDDYVRIYKDKIISYFVKVINKNFTYYQTEDLKMAKQYAKAKFDDENYNTISMDDYIEEKNEFDKNIKLCDISVEDRNEKDELISVKFQGIFAVAELDSSLDKEEILITNNRKKIYKKLNKVKLDSKEFERKFDVYSNFNIQTFENLTHDIMEQMVSFYKNNKIDFEILIKENYLYIRFDTGPMFEPNIIRKSNDIKTLWIYYNIMEFVINFTNELNKVFNDLNNK